MANKIIHSIFLLNALRTALIFIAGFLTYEILKRLENEWNIMHPKNEISHFAHRKMYHFLIIFLFDLSILYLIAFLFDIHL
jgi:hypothetical protein